MVLESEAGHARQAWSQVMDYNRAVHAELLAYRAQVQTHETHIQTRDARIGSLETLVATLIAQTLSLQTQLTIALGRLHTPEAREPARTDDPEDADSSIGNDDDSYNSGSGRRTERAARECTYSYFLKCQPLNFKGTEGVVGLTQWFEKMESVFHISNCTVTCQIKFLTCTLQRNALTWWNSHVKTISHDVAYGMTWKTLKKMMTGKYCPKGKIKKLDVGIKRLHDDLRVTAAQLVLLVQSYNCLFRVNAVGNKLQLLKCYNCSRIKTAKKIKIDWRSRILT
ncbi:hypothetical protein Tco_1244031 [Tanacetum coccineum]